MKHLHLTFVALSLIGFCLRGFWMLNNSAKLQQKWVRITPHIIDTGLLASAIVMLISYPLLPWQHPWLIAKIIALVAYIGLGTIAFKRHNLTALIFALVTFIYISSVAITKSPSLNQL
jgi:uncharacterized membrane protein SirB2|tara:strand:+ start:983 stop:1336 length:354 start_codon:yes stop_codon:yes gene_type:complete